MSKSFNSRIAEHLIQNKLILINKKNIQTKSNIVKINNKNVSPFKLERARGNMVEHTVMELKNVEQKTFIEYFWIQ